MAFAPYLISHFDKCGANPPHMISLDFQVVRLDSPAGAALRLEAAKERGQVVAVGPEAADDRDDFSFLSFLHADVSRL